MASAVRRESAIVWPDGSAVMGLMEGHRRRIFVPIQQQRGSRATTAEPRVGGRRRVPATTAPSGAGVALSTGQAGVTLGRTYDR